MTIVIENCNVVDVIKEKVINNSFLVIRDGRILHTGQEKPNQELVEKAKKIEGDGLWAVPGLMDLHAHVFFEGNPSRFKDFSYNESFTKSMDRAYRNLDTALKSGVIFIRDMGSFERRSINLKKSLKNAKKTPDVHVCGNLLTGPNGHGSEFGREASGLGLKKAVIDEINAGADFIKIVNDSINFNLEDLKSAVEVVHKYGKKVACHAYNEEQIEVAIQANVDSIEHGAPFNNETTKEIKDKKITIVPTFYCSFITLKNLEKSFVESQQIQIFEDWYKILKLNLPKAIKKGVKIVSGTDAGFPPVEFSDLYNEVIHLSKLGMAPIEAIKSTTINAAKSVGIDDKMGSIEVGKYADILLLKDDPIENINNLKNIEMVIKKGVPLRC